MGENMAHPRPDPNTQLAEPERQTRAVVPG